mmetsp:Transcript_35411/g.56883  ORF Transcript_35411/g.56883 Transcript_35411/m.56883 type:complete len:197 (-) Transcript_35411:235-825(-)|eukprot:jgi/Bigna1/87874/estExt_fgenesh1_pg.C_250084
MRLAQYAFVAITLLNWSCQCSGAAMNVARRSGVSPVFAAMKPRAWGLGGTRRTSYGSGRRSTISDKEVHVFANIEKPMDYHRTRSSSSVSRRSLMNAAIATVVAQAVSSVTKARADRTDIPDCLKQCIKECTAIAPKSGDYCKTQCAEFCAGEPPTEQEVVADDIMPADNGFSRLEKQKGSPLKAAYDAYGKLLSK